MSDHTLRWEYQDSYSGQDDRQFVQCSCGWRTRAIWSRLEIEPCIAVAETHVRAAATGDTT